MRTMAALKTNVETVMHQQSCCLRDLGRRPAQAWQVPHLRRGNRPLEMSKPTYRELATNFTLWCKFVLLEEQVSESEFNEMSIDEKLDILQGCFGPEIRALPRRCPQQPSRLG